MTNPHIASNNFVNPRHSAHCNSHSTEISLLSIQDYLIYPTNIIRYKSNSNKY